ncbi:IS110 family transposase [Palleronia sp. LCG004]|uniref:IS110 family transposase n=1 Tax=Palleronia sp. LCG004 TaxID=3079304 RepID=UPI002941D0AF|nr:transposase [Palleronia sp. LCG004]WOI57457.1 transposase [Palleronia sp. LCG004]
MRGTIVGIDVSETYLTVRVHHSGDRFRVRNGAAGLQEVRDRCLASIASLVVMEAKGRYHRATHTCLHEAGIPVAIIDAYRTKWFADIFGRVAKTDMIDAKILAKFAAILDPVPTELLILTMT